MADQKNNITNSNDYQRYLSGKMTAKERHAFEKMLLDDDFENEALEGFSLLDAGQLDNDLNHLKDKLRQRRKKKTSVVYWRMAAALLILGIFSFIIYFTIDFSSTDQIAQSKKTNPAEELVQADEPPEIAHDSVQKNERAAMAHNKQPKEQDKDVRSGQVGESMKVIAEENQNTAGEMILDLEADIAEGDQALSKTEPLHLPTFAEEEEVENEDASESVAEDEGPKLDMIAVAPATAKRVESVAARTGQEKSARTKSISGKVYSIEDEEGVSGVNVIIKGSADGVVTDINGEYTIDVPLDTNLTLTISSVGFMAEEIEVGEQSKIDIVLEPDYTSLSEIIVTGYGASSRNFNKAEETKIQPEPVGGARAFKDYIKENLQYPDSDLSEKIKGVVKLKFTVDADGNIQNLEVIKSLGSDFDKEAVRLLIDGPEWSAANDKGLSVPGEVIIKIRFRPPK